MNIAVPGLIRRYAGPIHIVDRGFSDTLEAQAKEEHTAFGAAASGW